MFNLSGILVEFLLFYIRKMSKILWYFFLWVNVVYVIKEDCNFLMNVLWVVVFVKEN